MTLLFKVLAQIGCATVVASIVNVAGNLDVGNRPSASSHLGSFSFHRLPVAFLFIEHFVTCADLLVGIILVHPQPNF